MENLYFYFLRVVKFWPDFFQSSFNSNIHPTYLKSIPFQAHISWKIYIFIFMGGQIFGQLFFQSLFNSDRGTLVFLPATPFY